MPPSSDRLPPGMLASRELIVGVCGGIAAYKTATVVSRLVQAGAGVTVVMTRAARRFVGAETFAALSGRQVFTSLWRSAAYEDPQHIRLTETADLCVIAPATANIIGKVAGGIADDLLSTLIMSTACPVLLAPAMNARMWQNPIVQRNVTTLREAGYTFVGPEEGWQACRTIGPGRMAEPETILETVVELLQTAKRV